MPDYRELPGCLGGPPKLMQANARRTPITKRFTQPSVLRASSSPTAGPLEPSDQPMQELSSALHYASSGCSNVPALLNSVHDAMKQGKGQAHRGASAVNAALPCPSTPAACSSIGCTTLLAVREARRDEEDVFHFTGRQLLNVIGSRHLQGRVKPACPTTHRQCGTALIAGREAAMGQPCERMSCGRKLLRTILLQFLLFPDAMVVPCSSSTPPIPSSPGAGNAGSACWNGSSCLGCSSPLDANRKQGAKHPERTEIRSRTAGSLQRRAAAASRWNAAPKLHPGRAHRLPGGLGFFPSGSQRWARGRRTHPKHTPTTAHGSRLAIRGSMQRRKPSN